MSTQKKIEIGNEGEEIATQHLIAKGYTLLERNYRAGKNEIDIIMQDGATVVFVEVKLRSDALYGYPEQFVTKAKQTQVKRAAEIYLLKNPTMDLRFDVVAIIMPQGKPPQIEHFIDAFY